MLEKMYVLRPDVIAEPIVRGWYAWPHLVSPITAALNLANRQIKTLASFVESPEIHEAAVKSPELRGGPFVDLPASKVADVKTMLDEALASGEFMIEFADQIRELAKACEATSGGGSLERLYDNVPDLLDGFIEFYYTDMGQASFRVIEPLLYQTQLYDETKQSLHLYIANNESRSFAFSTPRPIDDVVVINRPFHDAIHDLIGRLRFHCMPKKEIEAELIRLGLEASLLDPFITQSQDVVKKNPPAKASWRYFGHACVLVTGANGSNILVDPIIPLESSETGLDRFSFKDLPEQIDCLLITHNHADHVVIETLLSLRHIVKQVCIPKSNGGICDPSLKLLFEKLGFTDVIAMDPMDEITIDGMRIQALPFLGEHGDLDVTSKLAWHVVDHNYSFVFAADSNNLSAKMYRHILKSTGKIDAMFLGMECVGAPMSWVYGPLLLKSVDRRSDQSRRLNGSDAQRALSLIEALQCEEVYIYAIGREPWLSFIMSIDDDEETEQMRQAKMLMEHCVSKSVPAKLLFGKHEVIRQA